MDGLQEYLDDNPQLKEYVKDGVILWDKLELWVGWRFQQMIASSPHILNW